MDSEETTHDETIISDTRFLFSRTKHFEDIFLNDTSSDSLKKFLETQWRTYVDSCFRVGDLSEEFFVESDVESILIKPLEDYLSNSLYCDEVVKPDLNNSSSICGKIFKQDEKAYFCQDCSSDITRVLCNDCFRHSKHREHRYKILKTEGNGYCDCGDIDAWKNDPYCEKHTPLPIDSTISKENSLENDVNKLPADLIDRFTKLFKCICSYIVEILSVKDNWPTTMNLPASLQPLISTGECVVFLHKSEKKVDDSKVHNELERILHVDPQTARVYANVLEKEGRCPVKIGNKPFCPNEIDSLLFDISHTHSISKATLVSHSLVSHQCFVERLLEWLQKLGKSSKSFSTLKCKLLLDNLDENETGSFILRLLIDNFSSWQSARDKIHLLIVNTVLMDPFWKRKFALVYANNYKEFVKKALINNHFSALSTMSLSVQIFPVSSLTTTLLSDCNLFESILDTLFEISKINTDNLNFLNLSSVKTPEYVLSKFILIDLSYLLTNVPKEWTEQMRDNFLKGFRLFAKLLHKIHDMNGVVRLEDKHIEYEPQWEKSYFFLSKLQKPLSLMIEWCSSDNKVFVESSRIIIDEYLSSQEPLSYEPILKNEIPVYDILKNEVSLHPHLTRFIVTILAQLYRINESNFESFFQRIFPSKNIKQTLIVLVEPSIRAYVLYSQVNCGLWKRNGIALLNQAYLYHNLMFRNEFLDKDLLCLQFAAAQLHPDHMLLTLLNRFNLHDFLTNDGCEIPENIDLIHLQKLSEYFFELLIHIVCERFEPFLSKIEPNSRLEREVLHFLCNIEPISFSLLSTKVYRDLEHITNDIDLTNVLNKISSVKNSDCNLKIIYELKPEYVDLFNPFFYHYSNNDKSQTDEKIIKLQKLDKNYFIKPPNKLPEWLPVFSGISHLLDCDVFLKIVRSVMNSAASSSSNNEALFVKVLYLTGLALNEEYNDLNKFNKTKKFEFNFIQKIDVYGFFNFEDSLRKIIDKTNYLNDSYKTSTQWALNYFLKLSELKSKSDNNDSCSDLNLSGCGSEMSRNSDKQTEEKRLLKEKAEKRRQKILSKFNRMQQSFVENNTSDLSDKSSDMKSRLSESSNDFVLSDLYCFGEHRNIHKTLTSDEENLVCILCQQEADTAQDSTPMILLCYVQNSSVLCKTKPQIENVINHSLNKNVNQLTGIVTTTCGHTMHSDCWQKYIDSINLRNTVLNKNLKETFCPLCETISNNSILITPRNSQPDLNEYLNEFLSYENWYSSVQNIFNNNYNNQEETIELNKDVSEQISHLNLMVDINNNNLTIDESSKKLVEEFTLNLAELTSHDSKNESNLYSSVWSNCSYTIQAAEQLLKIEETRHFLDISEKHSTLISSLINQSVSYSRLKKTDKSLKSTCLNLLALLFDSENSLKLFEMDMFHLFISLKFSIETILDQKPEFQPNENSEFHLFRLILQCHCIQILINQLLFGCAIPDSKLEFGSNDFTSGDLNNRSEHQIPYLDEILTFIIETCQQVHKTPIIFNMSSLKRIKRNFQTSLLQFLRCSAIFYSNLFNVNKKVLNHKILKDDKYKDSECFNELISFFGLKSNFKHFLNIKNYSTKSLCKIMIQSLPKGFGNKLNIPLRLNKFVDLPVDYLDLISMSDNCDQLNIMCLVCGEMVRKQTFKLNNKLVGPCTAHAHACSQNTGIFLKIDECKILLLQIKFSQRAEFSEVTGCYVSAPYLDDHGETDQDLLKGNPLYLCRKNYQRLHTEWVSHTIPDRIFRHNRYKSNKIDMSLF